MKKRIVSLLCALVMLCLCLPAVAEDGGEVLTLTELEAWVESYKTRALATQPLNDPADDAANTEDGYAFIYDFATIYADRPEMTEDTIIKELVILSHEELGPHQTAVDMTPAQVMAAYYNENPNLVGDSSFATLYLNSMMPAGAQWAWVQRDGQRIMTMQYAVQEVAATGGDGYTDAGVIYTFQDEFVVAIRAYGLDTHITAEEVESNLVSVRQVANTSTYVQVPTSLEGSELEMFNQEDLIFEGMNFLTVTPEKAVEALGECHQDSWMADDNGEHIRTMEFDACEITFIYDAAKQNPVAELITMSIDGMEGPRAVRVGDTLASVRNRFRHGEGEFADSGKEVLYGGDGAASWGTAEYNGDGTVVIRYGFTAENNAKYVLYLRFEQMYLVETIIYLDR